MGKERPQLGVTKKKPSEDKVSKHENRHKKPKRYNHRHGDSDDESSKDSIEQEGGVSLFQYDDEKAANSEPLTKEDKKRRTKEERLHEEALKCLMEKQLDASPTASGLHVGADAGHRSTDKHNGRPAPLPQQMEKAKKAGGDLTETRQPADEDIFMIDVNPTPVNREKLCAQSDEDMEDGGALLPEMQPGYTAPPSGNNRASRRRLNLIEQEKARIQKKLGVKEGSDEKAQKVQQLLNKFIEMFDTKTDQRETKKNERKRRESARLRELRGKHSEKSTKKVRRDQSRVSRDD
ncbi:hypothetical protein Daus18300_004951 [Diaporthe australafricana]|uniref:Uncharacterized protein n=1 Tax=Diaporthe australafricana TaxID=127596 RepID=A0ABR3X5A4_9PEZI